MKKELEQLLNRKEIKNENLHKILSYVMEEPIFFDTEKRLLSLDEILNYKEYFTCNLDVIPLIDTYDNDFLVYVVGENQFRLLHITTGDFFGGIPDIREYLKLLEVNDLVSKLMKYAENKAQPLGLSEQTIQQVSNFCQENFDCYLPQEYTEFLHYMNGFSYDGYSIFCCYNDDIEKNFPRYAGLDLITINTNFYKGTDIDEYLLLGKSSIDYIGYIKATKKYVIMTNGTLTHIKEFDSFQEVIVEFLDLR